MQIALHYKGVVFFIQIKSLLHINKLNSLIFSEGSKMVLAISFRI